MSRIQANLVLLFAAAIWGGGFVAQSTAMDSIGPFWFIGLRFAVATVVILPFVWLEVRKAEAPLKRRDFRAFFLIGLALFGGAATQQVGLQTTTVTNSSFLTGLYVVFVPLLAVTFLGRRPHWIIWPGSAMAVFGIFLLSGGTLSRLSSGDFLTILCAAFWAIQITLVGLTLEKVPRPLALSAVQFSICALGGIAVGAMTESLSIEAISSALAEILYVGIFSSGLAFVLQVVGQRYTTAPQAAIFLSSEALFGALLASLILNETITGTGYIGCAIIFTAIMLVELVPELARRRTAAA